MERDPAIQKVVDKMSENMFGISQSEAQKENICVCCKTKVDPTKDFRNEISMREWFISNFCQQCQDKTFGVD